MGEYDRGDDGGLQGDGTDNHARKDKQLDVGHNFHRRFKVGCNQDY